MTRPLSLLATTALAFMLLSSSARSAPLLDQNQPNYNVMTPMALFYQHDLAQSFQQSSGNISGAGIFLTPYGSLSDTVTIALYDALPNAGGNLLASASGIGTAWSWFDVFWAPVPVTPGTT